MTEPSVETTTSSAIAIPRDDPGRAYRQVRTAFYERLAALVDSPTRPTATQGLAWRSGRPGHYHSLIVLSYIGDFHLPGCREGGPWTLDGRPVPRIHLNHYDWRPSQAQERRWSSSEGPDQTWSMIGCALELTVALEELVDFVPWVKAWAQAVEADDPALLLPPPHRLTRAVTAEEMFQTSYDWTLRADAEYDRRWNARAATAKRRNVHAGCQGCDATPGRQGVGTTKRPVA